MALRQPTVTLALSTTFTAPSSCAATHNINILPSPGYLIYWNEPVPAPSVTVSDCYPKEFLKSYTAVSPSVALALGSSVVPAMSPLVCPEHFCTAMVAANNYIACCPSGYKYATTTTALAVSSRPAYGGICYSDISISQSETAIIYDVDGSSVQQMWSPSTSGAQAYAHLIDGWAPSKATVGCASPSSSSTKFKTTSKKSSQLGGVGSTSAGSGYPNTTLAPSSASKKKKKKKTSAGAIAGAVIGIIAGLIAIIGAVLFWLRKRKQGEYKQAPVEEVHEAGDGQRAAEVGEYNQAPLLGGAPIHQLKGEGRVAEMSAPAPAAELPGGVNTHDTRRE